MLMKLLLELLFTYLNTRYLRAEEVALFNF
jgi:hypothetical protein